MTRRWLIVLSLLAHVGLGLFLFVTGIWRIERLDYRHRASLGLAVMIPPGLPDEGGASAAAKPTTPKRRDRREVVKEPRQPERRVLEKPETAPAIAATLPGEGEGTGTGSGTGSGSGDQPGDGEGVPCEPGVPCGDGASSALPNPVCGNALRESGETCDDGNLTSGDGCSASCRVETQIVAPTVLQGLRTAGDTQVHPPDVVKTTMLRDGKQRTTGVLKVCIATDGAVSSVSVQATTKYAEYDARLAAAARSWRYRPYTVNGRPMPVCGMVTFVYTIK